MVAILPSPGLPTVSWTRQEEGRFTGSGRSGSDDGQRDAVGSCRPFDPGVPPAGDGRRTARTGSRLEAVLHDLEPEPLYDFEPTLRAARVLPRPHAPRKIAGINEAEARRRTDLGRVDQ